MDAIKKFAVGASFQPLAGRELAAQKMRSAAAASVIPLSYLQTSYPAYIEELNKQRLCMYCGATYAEFENLGLFRCRMHPGVWIESDSRWSCCNRRTRGALACVQCDHVDSAVRDVALVLVPVFAYQLLPQKPRQALAAQAADKQATRLLFLEDAQRGGSEDDDDDELMLSADEIGYFRAHSIPVQRKDLPI